MANQSVAFDLFIRKGVDKLRSDARGRSAAAQQLAQACKAVSGTLSIVPAPPVAHVLGMQAHALCRNHSQGACSWSVSLSAFARMQVTSQQPRMPALFPHH